MLFLLACPVAHADTLLCSNGDRAEGTFVAREDGIIVFDSVHFGRLRVREAEASVATAEHPEPGRHDAPGEQSHPQPTTADGAGRRARTGWLDPWQGKLNFSLDLSDDSTAHGALMLEARLQRKWAKDELRLDVRYDYREDDFDTSTDLLKGTLRWRRNARADFFTLYRSTVEWNRESTDEGDYVLLQQEIGAGWTVIDRPDRSLRIGLAENLFNFWAQHPHVSLAKNTESVFLEFEVDLPWETRLGGRGVWYHAFKTGEHGWEHALEVERKLSESVTLGLRFEIRHNLPNVRVDDYRYLRLTVGYDL